MDFLKVIFKAAFSCFFCILFLPIAQVSAEQDIVEKLDNYIEDYLEEYQVPGASVAIVHNGEIFYSKSWGGTGESKEKVTSETPFTIGSISKSFTGLAVMKLIEYGVISLEDPVQKYLPWFTLKDREAASQMTIKQLLTHSSGISTYSGLDPSEHGATDKHAIQKSTARLSKNKAYCTAW